MRRESSFRWSLVGDQLFAGVTAGYKMKAASVGFVAGDEFCQLLHPGVTGPHWDPVASSVW